MKTTISITDFQFRASGYGHYKVTYRSPITGRTWTKTIDCMWLIDETMNAELPKKKDLNTLKRAVKQ